MEGIPPNAHLGYGGQRKKLYSFKTILTYLKQKKYNYFQDFKIKDLTKYLQKYLRVFNGETLLLQTKPYVKVWTSIT